MSAHHDMTGERVIGYCTNVHAGATLDETIVNLRTHALGVKAFVSPDESMGVGLWLPAEAARSLIDDHRIGELRDFLEKHGLRTFTFNGFPYGDFHQPVVKYAVYEPNWYDPRRAQYTMLLIGVLSELLGHEQEGSISSLPLGWGENWSAGQTKESARHLKRIADHCAKIESQTGTLVHIDLEPEPGCVLQRSDDVIAFFETYCQDELTRRYIRVCHDICHAVVMFEEQADVLKKYADAGIKVGKVQVSNAIRVMLPADDMEERQSMLGQLSSFAEDRYLHQTMLRSDGSSAFFDDLPAAIEHLKGSSVRDVECRVHFHVPIYLDSFGLIQTCRGAIDACIRSPHARDISHWEVETYAWNVLPDSLRQPVLAEGIAQELKWFESRFRQERAQQP